MSGQLSGSQQYDESLYPQIYNPSSSTTTTTTPTCSTNLMNNPPSAQLTALQQQASQHYTDYAHNNNAGQRQIHIDMITVNLAAAQLYATSKPVLAVQIQNLSTTDEVTINANGVNLLVPNTTAGNGAVLNPSPGSGQGGGTFNADNIDLASLTIQTSTNNSQTVAVIYET